MDASNYSLLVFAAVVGIPALLALIRLLRAARRMREQERERENVLLSEALRYMSQGLCMFNEAGRLVLWNDRFVEMYDIRGKLQVGYTLRDILQRRQEVGTIGEDPDEYARRANAAAESGQKFRHVFKLPDGRAIAVSNEPRPTGGWVSTHEDISDKVRAEQELQRTRTFLHTVIENVPATISVKQLPDFRYVLINKAGERHYGIPRERMLGRTAAEVFPPIAAATIQELDESLIRSGQPDFYDEHPVDTPGRGTRIVATSRLPIFGESGSIRYVLTVITDLTERRQAEARVEHMARHDPLTNLANRAAFNARLESAIAEAAQSGNGFAVLCIDIDRFKEVNDVFGHSAGDAVLCEVAQRFAAACEGAFLARVGGDEFTVIAPADSAERIAQRLLDAVAGEIDIAGQPVRTGLTIGIAVYPNDGGKAGTLLANADAALYRAKSKARGSFCFFEQDMDERLRAERALQQELRTAMARREFSLHYQPQASIEGEVLGFEALVRWQHPSGKTVSPAEFIPLAEQSGLIVSLGEWVLREACREAASWPKPLQIAVNLSPVQFQHGDLPALVHSVLLESGLKPSRLELEITEGVLIGDFSRAVAILRRLKVLGVRIAMDDFGTGYSSLSYLHSFPFDKMKIDRSFITNLERSRQAETIVRAVIGLGRGLDLPVTAEGVESAAQLEFLKREGCHQVQGYLIGRPCPIEVYAGSVGRDALPQTTALAG